MLKNYQIIDRSLLGYQGKLYPSDMIIEARGADVPEIRAWANIDENDLASIAKHVIDIIGACVKVTSKNPAIAYSYRDLYEHDKMFLLLYIHALTFADQAGNNVFVKCECSKCHKEFDKLAVTPANLKYNCPDDKYAKYIDSDKGVFVIPTKSYGKLEYKPSTIGLGSAMMDWIPTFEPEFIKDNQTMLRIVQGLVTDWRAVNNSALRKLQIERYNLMNGQALGFYIDLLDKLEITLSNELEYVCPDCGATFRCPLAFSGSYRSLFVSVQSFDDELQ
jgi:DNA-directed RNA polymerase subunit RPC12/RpoP